MGYVHPTLQSRTHTVRRRGVHRRVIVVIIEHRGSSTPAQTGEVCEEVRRHRVMAVEGEVRPHPTGLNSHAVSPCIVALETPASRSSLHAASPAVDIDPAPKTTEFSVRLGPLALFIVIRRDVNA